ncbi:MAG: sensor histidine kinase [Undibacterium sp.]|nr:sensor histidine kinase [Opitutaceae bacterium]
MHNRWTKAAVIAGGWAFLGFMLSLEFYLNARAGMKEAHVDFWYVAIPQFGRTAMWASLAPLILLLREKMPLNYGRWAGGVTFHLLLSFTVMAVYYLGRMYSYDLCWPEERFERGYWQTALKGFYGRNIIDMAYYWAVLAFGYSLEIYQKYKNEELRSAQLEARLIETELKALREQLRPHFLFNTMNTIAVLVREQKNDAAVTLIARLSTLLRMSLDPNRAPEVTLREELDFLERYVEIQKVRFSDRLEVNIAIEPAALPARIPNLLLQPIVENAILHGIAPKTTPGRVDVLAHVAGDILHIEVRDDGMGLPAARAGQPGIGLANTRARLEKIYGARHRLTLSSVPGKGVTVQIEFPCRL